MEQLWPIRKVRSLYTNRLEILQQRLASYEKVKRFTLLPKEFSMEKGELTNTLKRKYAARQNQPPLRISHRQHV